MGRRKPPPFVDVTIEGLDDQGRGFGEFDGRCVRIKNALPGERVTARILKRRRREWLAEAQTVLERSPNRQAAPCEVFPRCGGCAVQQLSVDAQLTYKQAALVDALGRHGVVPLNLMMPVSGPRYGYRTKARFGVRVVGDEPLVGFRETGSSRVARMDTCLTLTPALAALLVPLRRMIATLDAKMRVPQVEVAAGDTGQAVIVRHLDPLSDSDAAAFRWFGERHGVIVLAQPGGYDELELCHPAGGSPMLNYAVPEFGLCFEFHPTDFTQVNLAMNRRLASDAVAAFGDLEGVAVADLFCGIGNFSIALARAGARVIGIEGSAPAVDRARANARLNGLERRCEFQLQDLYDLDRQISMSAPFVLVDPPRTGLGEQVVRSIGPGVGRLVYVSCNPESFAADAHRLVDSGFKLSSVGVYDMFPNTAHVETLGVFER